MTQVTPMIIDWAELRRQAQQAADAAYAPYSRFHVGAALLSEDGRVFIGCNVENASFGLTVCAERTALFSAVTAGARRYRGIVVVTSNDAPVTPCGACRQVLHEFQPGFEVRCYGQRGAELITSTTELLPRAFVSADFDNP
jgi:cytidine deaminase